MRRAVQNLIRFIAAGLMIFGLLEICLEVVRDQMRKTGLNLWHCVLGCVLILSGGILFAFSAKLAERLTDDFEE